MAQADALRALARRGEEDLWCRGVRVLLEEVVLHLPRVADAEAVGQLDLLERIADETLLGALGPGPRELVLVEDAEVHARASAATLLCAARDGQGTGPRGPCGAVRCPLGRTRVSAR